MFLFRKLCLGVAITSAFVVIAGLLFSNPALWHPATLAACVLMAVGLSAVPALRNYQFTAWIMAAVMAAMLYPQMLLQLNPDDGNLPRNKWIMLFVVQIVMFGMGTQMRLRDFVFQGKMSYGVAIGLILQFSVMPLVGYAIGRVAGFPPDIAAGMVLIGSCSSGLASNVMTYLAKGNLALSVTVTAIGTLLAPLMTPFWMWFLAGELAEVRFVKMMLDIVKIVVVPIGAAMLHDYLKNASSHGKRIVIGMAALGCVWLAVALLGGGNFIAERVSDTVLSALSLTCFFWGAIVAGTLYHVLSERWPQVMRLMPRLSMCGIVYFTAVTTAVGRGELMKIGWLLLAAVILHNLIGYLLGYWLSRGCGLDVNSARTIALEVGIHNGAMATGVASGMHKLATVGLPAAIFSPWMNVSGSILANYWRKRPPETLPPNGETSSANEFPDVEDVTIRD